jgi:putative transposase
MDEYESLSHTKGECKYHVIFIPKFRRKVLYGKLRQHLGEVFRTLADPGKNRRPIQAASWATIRHRR